MPKGSNERRSSSGGLKRSPTGVNANGAHYVEILDGVLYVERAQVEEFKSRLKELCGRFDYKFVPFDALADWDAAFIDGEQMQALKKVLAYLEDEAEHYEASDAEEKADHIYNDIRVLESYVEEESKR
jgi:hypothetical protein